MCISRVSLCVVAHSGQLISGYVFEDFGVFFFNANRRNCLSVNVADRTEGKKREFFFLSSTRRVKRKRANGLIKSNSTTKLHC